MRPAHVQNMIAIETVNITVASCPDSATVIIAGIAVGAFLRWFVKLSKREAARIIRLAKALAKLRGK